MKNLETLEAGLYLVAVPIGNMRDITLRALDVLRRVDVVFCEDTRVTGKILKAYDIFVPLRVYNDHSDEVVRNNIVSAVEDGQCIALVSDAGTPMICDPGYKLLRACHDAEVSVTSLPGANAVLPALQLSGMPSDAFSFIGFLPSKMKARQDFLRSWQDVHTTLIAYETAPRLIKALEDIQTVLGARDVAVVRELTKLYEEARRGSVSELLAYYTENGAPKGEIVLVIDAPQPETFSDEMVKTMLVDALEMLSTKDAARHVASKTGRKVSMLYNWAIALKDQV